LVSEHDREPCDVLMACLIGHATNAAEVHDIVKIRFV
jgi:hypothetical protein